jgi:L-threonylcarbamoyladenylate synthase
MVTESQVSDELIEKAVKAVKGGGVIIFPTDTVYGIGCDPTQASAVRRVFELKQRRDKPFPVLASSIDVIGDVAELSETALELGASFWPGALTLLLKRRKGKLEEPTLKLATIGVRVPNHGVPLRIAEAVGGFLVGTSANLTGGKTPARFEDIPSDLVNRVDLAIKGGVCRLGQESTIVDATRIPPAIVREGALKRDVVEEFFRGSP